MVTSQGLHKTFSFFEAQHAAASITLGMDVRSLTQEGYREFVTLQTLRAVSRAHLLTLLRPNCDLRGVLDALSQLGPVHDMGSM